MRTLLRSSFHNLNPVSYPSLLSPTALSLEYVRLRYIVFGNKLMLVVHIWALITEIIVEEKT